MLASMRSSAIASIMAAQSSKHNGRCEEEDTEGAEGLADATFSIKGEGGGAIGTWLFDVTFAEEGLTGEGGADPLPLAWTG